MTTQGQITIAGETISGFKLNIGPLTLETLPQGLTLQDMASLRYRDRLRVEIEVVVERAPTAGGKFDADNGTETGAPLGLIHLKPLRGGVTVTGILPRAVIDAAWEQDHAGAMA